VNAAGLVGSRKNNKTPRAEVKATQPAVIYAKKNKSTVFFEFENGLNGFWLPESPFAYRNSGLF
jgi:hypothetical protein